MTNAVSITSSQNQHFKAALRLRESRARRQQQRILIDGLKESMRAVAGGIALQQIYFSSELGSLDLGRQVENLAASGVSDAAPVLFDLSPDLYQRLAYGDRSGELVCVAATSERSLECFSPQQHQPPLIVVIEGVEKPGNVGAVIRSACGAGCSGMIVADPGTDLFNPNTIRASLGAVFSIPICTATSQQARDWLAERQINIVATRVDAETAYHSIDYRLPTAVVMGSEADGLSAAWSSDELLTEVIIPMDSRIDSLNISVTAAIMLFEARRQRSL